MTLKMEEKGVGENKSREIERKIEKDKELKDKEFKYSNPIHFGDDNSNPKILQGEK